MNKPIIEDVIISEYTLAQLNSKLKLPKFKRHMIRKYVGGVCTTYGGIPVKKVIWEVDNGNKL